MKTPVPVTIDDLEATAKDDKNGLACYRFVEVHWYWHTKQFHYYYKGKSETKKAVVAFLKYGFK